MTDHSPTPLKSNGCEIIGADGFVFATATETEGADTIVRAVNAHDELVAALRETEKNLERFSVCFNVEDLTAIVKAALAQQPQTQTVKEIVGYDRNNQPVFGVKPKRKHMLGE